MACKLETVKLFMLISYRILCSFSDSATVAAIATHQPKINRRRRGKKQKHETKTERLFVRVCARARVSEPP